MWLILDRWKPGRGCLDGPEAIAFVVLIGAFLFPIKGYDFAVFSIVFAMIGTMPVVLQAILATPMMILWRPALGEMFLTWVGLSNSIALVNTMILVVLATLGARLVWPIATSASP